MPRAKLTDEQIQDEGEKLFLELAKAEQRLKKFLDIGARLKQTGARWKRSRVNKMGVVCSLFYADQWDDYWKYAK